MLGSNIVNDRVSLSLSAFLWSYRRVDFQLGLFPLVIDHIMAFAKKRSASFIDDSDASSTAAPQAPKKTKTVGSASPAGKDDDGNPYWDVCRAFPKPFCYCSSSHYLSCRPNVARASPTSRTHIS